MTPMNRRQLLATGLAAGLLPTASRAAAEPGGTFKLGLVTYNLAAAMDLDTTLRLCREGGLAAVEFRTTHKHGVEPTLSKEQRKEVRRKCADAGVTIWACGSTCEFHDPSRAVVEKNIESCKAFVDLVADLGGKGVKVRPNGLPASVPEAKTLEQIGKALAECGKAAESAGVEIHVEVHGRGTADPGRMKTILEHCGHKSVGITWNSNADDVKDGSVSQSFAKLRPWLMSCHINQLWKDSTGAYPYRELFRLLRLHGYDRYTLIELGKGFPDYDSTLEFVRYYKALWTELNRG